MSDPIQQNRDRVKRAYQRRQLMLAGVTPDQDPDALALQFAGWRAKCPRQTVQDIEIRRLKEQLANAQQPAPAPVPRRSPPAPRPVPVATQMPIPPEAAGWDATKMKWSCWKRTCPEDTRYQVDGFLPMVKVFYPGNTDNPTGSPPSWADMAWRGPGWVWDSFMLEFDKQ